MEKWKCCYYFCKRLLRTSCWGWYSVEASVISTNALHSCLPRMVAIKKSHNKSYCFFILWNEATDDLRVMSNLKSNSSMLNHLPWVVLKWGCKHAKRLKVRLYSEVICGHGFEDYEVGVRGWSLEGKWGHQRRPFFFLILLLVVLIIIGPMKLRTFVGPKGPFTDGQRWKLVFGPSSPFSTIFQINQPCSFLQDMFAACLDMVCSLLPNRPLCRLLLTNRLMYGLLNPQSIFNYC